MSLPLCFGGATMTQNEKNIISRMRKQGVSYGNIAAHLGLSVNTVKSFCRRNKLQRSIEPELKTQSALCPHCGEDIEKEPKRTNRKFCSEKCRREWWKTHDHSKNRRAFYSFICACCGSDFESYGNNKRKYCGHACYIKARFCSEGGVRA